MWKLDRRERLALDEVYQLYKHSTKDEKKPSIYQIANSLTTLNNLLTYSCHNQFKLTKRLWQRIFENLCDLLITSFPVYIIVYDEEGQIQTAFEPIMEPAIIEIRSQMLHRKTDIFSLTLDQLNPLTKARIINLWLSKGPMFSPEDFTNLECGDFCAPKNFIIGDEVLKNESEAGRERAYKKWWELYWQAYCMPNSVVKKSAQEEMHNLEEVWGNLYY